MDRIWQWAWDRHGPRYSWTVTAVSYFAVLPVWLGSTLLVVAFEESDRYVEAAAATLGIVMLLYASVLPGLGSSRVVEGWAAGREVDRSRAMAATYTWVRGLVARVVGATAVFSALLFAVVGAIAAVSAAVLIHRLVAERFGGELRIGIGINTGKVIAGTIGAGGKLEFTLIGDTVNVAARVEQLTKTTGDSILLTQHTAHALASGLAGLTDRGSHTLKGKSAAVKVFGLDPR